MGICGYSCIYNTKSPLIIHEFYQKLFVLNVVFAIYILIK